jgi:hypothetical protein
MDMGLRFGMQVCKIRIARRGTIDQNDRPTVASALQWGE